MEGKNQALYMNEKFDYRKEAKMTLELYVKIMTSGKS